MEKEYRNPTPTVDAIIEIVASGKTRIVLIERKNPPFGFALPGGFVDEGEMLSDAVIREALEETGLDISLTEQFFTYSDPSRDPRQHTLSTVYLATAQGEPVAGDDAKAVFLADPDALPEMVFDHAGIIEDYRRYREQGLRPSWDR